MFSITIQPATVGNTLHLELLVCLYMEVSLHGTILDPRPFMARGSGVQTSMELPVNCTNRHAFGHRAHAIIFADSIFLSICLHIYQSINAVN